MHTIFTNKLSPLFQNLYKARVLKDFFIYSFGSLILRAVSLFLIPLIMRILTPADYGTLALTTAFITISTAIIGLGLRQMLSIEYFHLDELGQKKLINELLIIYTIVALPTLSLAWQLRHSISTYIFFDTITNTTLIAALSSIFLFFYAELLYQLMQYNRHARELTILQLLVATVTMLSTLYTLWILKWGIAGVVIGQACGQLFATCVGISLYYQHTYHHHRSAKKTVKKIIPYARYGAPFIPGIICSWILASSDRWMLGYYYTMKQVGIYSIADLFAQVFNALILVPWAGSYLPYILKQYKKHEDNISPIDQENSRTMWISLAAATICITLGLTIGKPLLLIILPPSYHPSLNYVWILLMGQVFLLGSYFASARLQYQKQTTFIALALILPALLNLFLNYLLIDSLGILGCSLATLLSYLAYFAITLWRKRHTKK
jgi:O-antigen/teichoic acid export membrane protein